MHALDRREFEAANTFQSMVLIVNNSWVVLLKSGCLLEKELSSTGLHWDYVQKQSLIKIDRLRVVSFTCPFKFHERIAPGIEFNRDRT